MVGRRFHRGWALVVDSAELPAGSFSHAPTQWGIRSIAGFGVAGLFALAASAGLVFADEDAVPDGDLLGPYEDVFGEPPQYTRWRLPMSALPRSWARKPSRSSGSLR
jgi:hypothetical protein